MDCLQRSQLVFENERTVVLQMGNTKRGPLERDNYVIGKENLVRSHGLN